MTDTIIERTVVAREPTRLPEIGGRDRGRPHDWLSLVGPVEPGAGG